MRLLICSLLAVPLMVFAQSGGIGGGAVPREPSAPQKSLETKTVRDVGTGQMMSKLDACTQAKKSGNTWIGAQNNTLRNYVIKGSMMSDCSCEGPHPVGKWYNCTVDVSVTYTDR